MDIQLFVRRGNRESPINCSIIASTMDQTNREVSPPPLAVETEAGAAAKDDVQVEEGISATGDQRHMVKAQENMEFGAGIAGSSVCMMVAWYFLSPETRGADNLRYVFPMLLGLACFISGVCLMLLSANLLMLPEHLVSEVQCMASKYLPWLCSTLLVVTLPSPLVLYGYKVYWYVSVALLVVVTAPLTGLRWYMGFKAEGGDEEAAYQEHKEQLEAAFKLISAMNNSATGALVTLMVNYSVTGGSGRTKSVVLVSIFFLFITVMVGLFSMEIRTTVLEINSRRLRRFIIRALWLAIIFMLSWMACAVLAEVFDVVGFCIFAAFGPLIFAALVYLVHCICPGRANEYHEAQLKWKAEKGIKITMWSFTAIIGIFAGFLHGPDKIESLKACIILLTAAFLSGFALTVLTIRPNSTSAGLAAATTVLDWTAAATFAAAIFAVIIAMILEIL